MNVSDDAISDRALNWVKTSIAPAADVLSVRRMYGGISSKIHRITLQVDHEVKDFVLRQFDNEEWLRQEPDLVLHEAESLRWAARTGVQTPQIVAYDETGSACGAPAVLMTLLQGTVALQLEQMDAWLGGLAEALTKIHVVEDDSFPWTYYSYMDHASFETPSWSKYPEQWNRVIEIVRGPRPPYKPIFIHRDYHPTNVLWVGDKVSGVVDWVNSCRGPAGIDVGHCRVNLAQLYGVAAADGFLQAYVEQAGPSFKYEPYWDIVALIDILFGTPSVYQGWTALGMTGLTDSLMMERLDAYMLSLLQRAEGSDQE